MVLNYIFVSATSMFILNKVCANIKPAIIFFCLALFITLPLLANSKWITKFQISLTPALDTTPVKNIDTIPSKKITADTLKPEDTTVQILADTSINDTARRFSADTLLFSKDSLDAPVSYTAQDSGVLIIPDKQFYLYGNANTNYQDIKLNANTIKYDQSTNLITAYGGTDTSKGALNLPTFAQGDQTSVMDTVFYNLRTQKGLTKNTYYKAGEMFVNAQTVKKADKNVEYAYRGRFTTCNLDTPHFDIRAKKMKIINDKLAISGPAYPEFEGVPVPIFIPFGIYPLQRGRHSGLLPPRFTTSDVQGLGLEGLGFYKVLGPNWDARVETDLYSYGGWNLRITPEYYKRYKYRGNLTFSVQHPKLLNAFGTAKQEFQTTTNYHLNWSHSTDSKARPGTSFSASVDAGSTQYNKYVTDNAFRNYDNNLSSSIAYSKTWADGKYNLSVNLNENQNSVSRLINLNLPTVAFNVATIYPFQNPNQAGSSKWYQKLSIGYSGNLQNVISFYDSAFNLKRVLDTVQWGVDHRIPISLSLPPIGPFVISPSVSYEERWYAQKILYAWNDKTLKVDTSLQKGFYAAREMSFGLSTSTRIFGTFNFKHSRIMAIRHEVDPFISLSYKPDLVSQFYQNVKTDIFGRTARVSQLSGNVFGNFSEQKFGGLNFGINNLLEMKVRNRDSTGEDSVKKVRLLDNLSISSGYNLISDSLQVQPISIRAGSSLFNNKMNVTAGAVINPYQKNEAGKSELLWKQGKLGNFESGNLALSTSFQSKSKDNRSDEQRIPTDETLTPDEQQRQLEYVRENPGEFVDFNIPWSVQLSYSLNYSHYLSSDLIHFVSQLNSNININGDLSISPKWKIGGGLYFDFRTRQIQATSIYLTRDMHCWQMVIDVNVGQFKSFTITLNPKSGILRDLHINKHFLQQ